MRTKENYVGVNIFKILWQKKWLFICYILLLLLSVALSFLTIVVTAKALECLTVGDYGQLLFYGVYTIMFALLLSIKDIARRLLLVRMELYTLNKIEDKICERLYKICNSVYSSISSGSMARRVNSVPSESFGALIDISNSIVNMLYSVCIIVFVCFLNYIIGIMVIGAILLIAGLRLIVDKIDNKNWRIMHNADEKMCGKITETVRGHKDIKCLDLDENINKEVNATINDYVDKAKNWDVVFSTLNSITNIIISLYIFSMVFVAIILYEHYFLSYFAFIYILNYYNSVRSMAYDLSNLMRQVTQYKNNQRRLNQLFREDLMPIETFGSYHLGNVKGEIEFKNIVYSYEHIDINKRLDDDMKKLEKKKKNRKDKKKEEQEEIKEPKIVLNGFNLKIKAGEKIAFVGKSGCGKSTLVAMLSKSIVPTSGEILLDGVPYNDLDSDSIRGNITIINQYPYIYYMSLRDNISIVKPDASDEEILQACEKANLTEFIKDLPYGLDTMLGENGVKLSGGQKQRIAIARAFLRNTRILVFDESTSSLDNFSQKIVQDNIDAIKNRTVIIVAHRLSTIINCDRIVFIDEGKVEAVGKFDELINTSAKFANLYRVRSK